MKNKSNHPLNNHVVKILSEEHGKKIIQAFKYQLNVNINNIVQEDKLDWYFGLVNGIFVFTDRYDNYITEITLEELQTYIDSYPKQMLVWDDQIDNAIDAVVVAELPHNAKYKYLAAIKTSVKDILEGNSYEVVCYKNAK